MHACSVLGFYRQTIVYALVMVNVNAVTADSRQTVYVIRDGLVLTAAAQVVIYPAEIPSHRVEVKSALDKAHANVASANVKGVTLGSFAREMRMRQHVKNWSHVSSSSNSSPTVAISMEALVSN